MANRRSGKGLLFVLLFLAVAVAAVYSYQTLLRPKNQTDPSRLAKVERGDLARSVVATGRIEPIAKVEIKSKANGIIQELKVAVSDLVVEGQVLAELDKEFLSARARETQAGLMSARANLGAAEAQLRKNGVEAEGPDVPFARRNLERIERLFKDRLVAQQAWDDARSALEQAENRQNVARSQLAVSEARIAQARAEVAQANAAVERAQEELNDATIRSPIRGMVLSRDIEIGSPVSSILNMGAMATLVMVLGDIRQVYVRGKVDESDIGAVRVGQPARIRVEAFKNRQFDGRVTQISPLGIEKDNVINFEVRVSIDNSGGELRANMTANAEIVLEERKGVLIVPEGAVIYDARRDAWVEVPDAIAKTGRKKKAVKIGFSNGSRTQVLSGLSEGDPVILQ